MNRKVKRFGMVFLSMGLLSMMLVAVDGCKKSEPPAEPETEIEEEDVSGTEKMTTEVEKMATEAKQMASEAEESIASAVEQTICPVIEGPINKDIFTEYKGKKVYFCCESCKTEFEKDPEKYIAKLPQFK